MKNKHTSLYHKSRPVRKRGNEGNGTGDARLHGERRLQLQNEQMWDLRSQLEASQLEASQLEVSNAMYEDLYNQAPVSYVSFDERWRIHEINFAACNLLACERAHALGQPFTIFLKAREVSEFLEHLRRSKLSERPERIELTLQNFHRECVPVEVHTMALRDSSKGRKVLYRSSIIDLSEHQRISQALKESETRYRLLAEAMPQFVMTATADGNIDYCNSHALRFMGLNAEEAPGKWMQVIHPADRRLVGSQWEQVVKRGVNAGLELRYCRSSDRQYLWHYCRFLPLRENGIVYKILIVAHDIHERKQAEMERENLMRELAGERTGLARRVKERTVLLHKLNRKLSGEIAQRTRLEHEVLRVSEHERRRFGQDVHDGFGQQLSGIALLAKSLSVRLEKGGDVTKEQLDRISSLLTKSVDQARSLAHGLYPQIFDAEGLVSALQELAAGTQEALDCHFECARNVRLDNKTVALNLYRIAQEAVTNAVKHAAAKNLTISLRGSKERVTLTVVDDGKGFSKRAKHPGMGLQTMAYRARIINGNLAVKSSPKGTAVICSLDNNDAGNHEKRGIKRSKKGADRR